MALQMPVLKCNEGDILAEDVFNEEGVKLVSSDTMINSYILDKLQRFSIGKVRIYSPAQSKSNKKFIIFNTGYKKSVIIVKNIVNDLAFGKKLDAKKLKEITDIIYQNANDENSGNIIKYLNKIKDQDQYTYMHSINVSFYCMLIAKWLNLTETEIKKSVQSGFLHDIGKVKVPNEILNKKAKLTDDEFNIIKKHPVYGYYILEENNFVDLDIKRAVLLHHERVNRTGYPFNITANSIGLLTRIVSVADVYDAMTSDRVYKKKATPFDAFEMFMSDGYSIFDSYVTSVFISHMAAYFTGSDVKLSDGKTGKIAYIPPQDILSPVVCSNGEYYSIKDRNVKIAEML